MIEQWIAAVDDAINRYLGVGADGESSAPEREADDPSPEEIRERCQAIRATWSPAERRQRTVGVGRFMIPTGRLHELDEPNG